MAMNGKYLFDANVIIDVFRGKMSTIEKVKDINLVYIPAIVLGELYYGANKSNQTDKRKIEIEELEKNVTVLNVSQTTAHIYGEIKNILRGLGKPIPENDIWIAAIAKEYDLILITRDKHFNHIKSIRIQQL
jgi:tRNA(fMet)-specific endonuclease VapC